MTLTVSPSQHPTPGYGYTQERSFYEDPGDAARRVIRGPGRVLVGLLLIWLVSIAFMAEVAYLWSAAKPDVFAARSEIQYRGETWVETQAEALRSEDLYLPIAAAEGIEPTDFLEDMVVGQVPGTQILGIEFHSQDARQALRIVETYTATYLERFEIAPVSEAETILATRIALLEQQLADVEAADLAIDATNLDPNPTAEQLQYRAQATSLRLELGSLKEQLTEAELETIRLTNDQPTVSTAPFILDEPVEPKPVKRAVLGGLLGAVLGGFGIFVLVWRVL